MSRKARNFYLSDFYHIMVQGDEKKYIFKKENYKEKYIYLLKRNAFRNDVKIIAYCVMDNHVHILVHTKDQKRMSKMMSQCGTSYGLFYSKERKNIGHVFRDRYKSEPIYTKNHLINCIKYIHHNPVKANIVASTDKYLYSSYNEFFNKKEIYQDLKKVCYIETEDYVDIIESENINEKFIEIEGDFEDYEIVFERIKNKYDLQNLRIEDIFKIYYELKEKSNASKTLVAKLLKIERNKFSKILKDTN